MKLIEGTKEAKAFFKEYDKLTGVDKTNFLSDAIKTTTSSNLKEYLEQIGSAEASYEGFVAWTKKSGKEVSIFSAILSKAKGAIGGLLSGLANAAIGFVVGKVIELAGNAIYDYTHKTEKLKEAAQKTADAIDDEEQKLSDAKSELEEINQKINDLLSKDSLTFVEEQDLVNLREQKALLEDELRLKKEILTLMNKKKHMTMKSLNMKLMLIILNRMLY